MNNKELYLEAEGPMIQIRTHIDRARVIMGDLMTRYFQDVMNDPDTEEGRKWIARGFKPYGIRAGIIEDAVFVIDEAFKELEMIMEKLNQ